MIATFGKYVYDFFECIEANSNTTFFQVCEKFLEQKTRKAYNIRSTVK